MAKSVNIQYVDFSDEVHSKYVKTVVHSVGGYRYDPATGKQVDFYLSTPESSFDFANKIVKGFDYEGEVIEIYSPKEDTFFKRTNRKLFEEGILKPYYGEPEDVDETNVLDDKQVEEIASIGNLKAAEKKINELTSVVTLNRILESMNSLGRKDSFRQLARARIEVLDNESKA